MSASLTSSICCDQIAHAVAVDFHAQLHLGFDLVAFGHGHLPHVVAQAGDFQVPHVVQSDRGPHPGGQTLLDLGFLPMPDDDFPRLAQSACR